MVGIFSWYGIRQVFEKRIKAIKCAGFDATAIWIDEDGQWETDPEDMPKIIRDNGLILEYAHAPYSRCNSLWDQTKHWELEEEIKKHINYCSRHGIPILVTHLTKGYRVKEANEHGLNALKRIVSYAKDNNVSIAAENTKQNAVVEKVFAEIGDRALGLCFDTSHDNLYSDRKFSLLEKYHDRLLCLHISDNDGRMDDHWIPYQGMIDWNEFVRKFPKEYGGILNLEILSRNKDDDEMSVLGEAYGTIRGIEEKIASRRQC